MASRSRVSFSAGSGAGAGSIATRGLPGESSGGSGLAWPSSAGGDAGDRSSGSVALPQVRVVQSDPGPPPLATDGGAGPAGFDGADNDRRLPRAATAPGPASARKASPRSGHASRAGSARSKGTRRSRGDGGEEEAKKKESVTAPVFASTSFYLHSSAKLDEISSLSRSEMIAKGINPQWTTPMLAKRRMRTFHEEVAAIQRATEPRTLALMIRRMEEKGREAHKKISDIKWQHIVKLRRGLKRAPGNATFGRLYHALNQAEPSGRISEARLMSVFAMVYDIDFGAPTHATKVRTAPSSLTGSRQYVKPKLYSREEHWMRMPRTGRRRDMKRKQLPLPGSYFSGLFKGLFAGFSSLYDGAYMDYREFMCAFQLVQHPRATVPEVIDMWCQVYASHGKGYTNESSPLNEEDFCRLFAFGTVDAGVREDLMYRAHVAAMEHGAFYRDGESLITRKQVATIFEPVPHEQIRDLMKPSMFTTEWSPQLEYESLYSPTLQAYLAHKRRRHVTHRIAMWHFACVTWRKYFDAWTRWIAGRGIQREFLRHAQHGWVMENFKWALDKMRLVATWHAAAVEIQRIVRARGAKELVEQKRRESWFIYDIQRCVRGFVARQEYRRKVRRKARALLDCQRMIRGFLGRCRVRTLVVNRVAAQREAIAESYVRLEEARRERAASGLQALYRSRMTRRRVWEEHEAKLRAEAEHDAFVREETRKKLTYRQQMVEYVDAEREAKEANEARERHDQKQKEIIEWRARFKKWEVLAKVKNKEKSEWEEHKRVKREDFETTWQAKTAKEMDRVRKYVLHLIEAQPYDKKKEPEKRRDQDEIMEDLKQKTKDNRARAKKEKRKHYDKAMAQKDAKDDIIRDWQQRSMDGDYGNSLNEAKEALETTFEERDHMMQSREDAEYLRTKAKAHRMMRDLLATKRARKEVRHRLEQRVVRDYDARQGRYFYRNRRTGEMSWDKPRVLGKYEDLPIRDHWIIRHDDNGDMFFFNAHEYRMTWDMPPKCQLCEVCGDEFAAIKTKKQYLCVADFEKLPEPKPFWKPFDGSAEHDQEDVTVALPSGQDIKPPVICAECEDAIAWRRCLECGDPYCRDCWDTYHAAGKSKMHTKLPVNEPEPEPVVEEAGAYGDGYDGGAGVEGAYGGDGGDGGYGDGRGDASYGEAAYDASGGGGEDHYGGGADDGHEYAAGAGAEAVGDEGGYGEY